jgi:hypothetical protein
MKFGFNSKAQVGPDVYHVQTEDRGAAHLFIDTLVLTRGQVVYRHSTSYQDLAATGALDLAILRARVEKQHREILEALRAGVLSLEKEMVQRPGIAKQRAPSPGSEIDEQEGVAVKLLNAASWLDSGQVSLNIEVSEKIGGQPVTGAHVQAFIEDGTSVPESHFGHTDADGLTSLRFPLPILGESSLAALVIRAQVGKSLHELRYHLKPARHTES